MTIEECYQTYGHSVYVASGGESLLWVCRRLYGSDGSLYRRVLRVLNGGLNWRCLGVGDRVAYVSGESLSMGSVS